MPVEVVRVMRRLEIRWLSRSLFWACKRLYWREAGRADWEVVSLILLARESWLVSKYVWV